MAKEFKMHIGKKLPHQGGVGKMASDGKAPKPEQAEKSVQEQEQEQDPTRFGDWSVNGRCIDF